MASSTAVIPIATARLESDRTAKKPSWICCSSCSRTATRSAYSARSWCSIPAEPLARAINRNSVSSVLISDNSK